MPGRVLAYVMAGGEGNRLQPLTQHRAKPAVPFGGSYRIIDFVLSNLVHSGINSIYILTQYKAQPLIDHVYRGWTQRVSGRDQFITVVPAQMQLGTEWYRGTADSVYQNLNLVDQYNPDVVLIFGADHIYKMNIAQMVRFHRDSGAKATVACLPVPREEASQFGIIDVDARGKVLSLIEKPDKPPGMPGNPGKSLASMGNYAFDPNLLREVLQEIGGNSEGQHDFGHNVLPGLADSGVVWAYDFSQNRIPGTAAGEEEAYWRDVGTLEAYYDANMDLKNVQPCLNLFNWKWPILTVNYNDPPTKFVFDDNGRRGELIQSTVAAGCIIAGGRAKDSILGRNVVLDAGSEVRESILMDNVHIGAGARIRRAIIDKNAYIPPGQWLGYDLAADRQRYHVTDSGLVVIPKAPETPETRERDV
ncbi:MAG: glucose-1-phosphate adenylyltransferase [Acidobacteria bacterium]|nr:glucose-1-phosphate adenylyltransferase [Acidobacteriota bacterium]